MSRAPQFELGSRVWVGGLADGIEAHDLADTFEEFGRIENIRVLSSANDTYAFIQFDDNESAYRAIKEMNQKSFHGRTIKVSRAASDKNGGGREDRGGSRRSPGRRRSHSRDRGSYRTRSDSRRRSCRSPRRNEGRRYNAGRTPPREKRKNVSNANGYKVLMRNLPVDMNWSELKDLARQYGQSVIFTRTFQGKNHDYCGIVEYGEKHHMEMAVKSLDGKRVHGEKTRLQVEEWHGDNFGHGV